jgi:hypothetical protein
MPSTHKKNFIAAFQNPFQPSWVTRLFQLSEVGLPAQLDDASIFIFKGAPF